MAIQDDAQLAPAARAENAGIVRGDFIDGGRAVPAGHGWEWVVSGWTTFRKQPGTWVLIAVVLGVFVIAVSLVPFLGSVALPLIMPILVGSLMVGCARLERGESIGVADLFTAFNRGAAPLLMLGLIGLGLTIAAMIPAAIAFFMLGPGGGRPGGPELLLIALVYLALLLPVYMALWFGPPLVAVDGEPPTRAIRQSFRGCLKNVVAFLVYSLVLVPLAVAATLPLFLGWLVLGPLIVTSIYAAYRDIFFQN